MDVSVVITCFNEEANIGPCLLSLLAQDYPKDSFEILVVDGGSRDGTQGVVSALAREHGQIRLEVESKKGTAAGRNAGIDRAHHGLIAFIDADCEAPPNWLSVLVGSYGEAKGRDEKIAGVGGTNLAPPSAGPFVRAIGIALDSYLGSFGSAQGRQFSTAVLVDGLATLNALFSREVLQQMGRFDESLASEAEDADLNFRLRQSGYRLLFVPESFVWHKMRPTPRGWLRNMFRYGKGRARLLKRHRSMWKPAYLLPLLFLLCMASILLAPLWSVFFIGLAYFPAVGLFSWSLARRKGTPQLAALVALVFFIQHFGYAAGECYGLCNSRVR